MKKIFSIIMEMISDPYLGFYYSLVIIGVFLLLCRSFYLIFLS